jgi:hypothetical protein
MDVIRARNVNDALALGVEKLFLLGVERGSRAGKTIEHPEPVTTVYECPDERVLFSPERDANPFFHLFEALWMLAGRRDVKWIEQYNARMREYSDDGINFHGAYGNRWRNAFPLRGPIDKTYETDGDQLAAIIKLLREDPESRRAVLQMWHAPWDLGAPTKDQPCNTHVYFKIRDGKLLMTVCCRSNDIVWGTFGANAVHFSILQEYLAERIGVAIGPYTQVSDSFHAYVGVWEKLLGKHAVDLYQDGVEPTPLGFADPEWAEDLDRFLHAPSIPSDNVKYRTPFFHSTVRPLFMAIWLHKAGETRAAIEATQLCGPRSDWGLAARRWLERRLK